MSIDQSSPVPRVTDELSPSTSYYGNDHDTSLESLCRECRATDWAGITDSRLSVVNQRFSRPLRIFGQTSRSQLLKSNCRICRLVGCLVSPKYGDNPLNQAPKLYDHSLFVYLDIWEGLSLPGGSKERAQNNETAGIRPLEPLRVNFDFLSRMLNECLGHEQCRSTRVKVARLRVIDVTTKRICQAPPDCEYIALSYVWGGNSACKSTQGEFPQVVQEAFTVTEALGYRYLWVDRYCIEQNPNSSHMQSMINQMDLVYSNARATVVAASGNSASDGLPGISVPRYQAHAVVGETHLIEVSKVVDDIILSKWFTRGWTYQEWYFSRRRLVFAEGEVLFVCNEGMAKESGLSHECISSSLKAYKLRSMKPPGFLKNDPVHSRKLESHISEYSKRNLSHDCDSLNAFAGILRHYELSTEDRDKPLSHLWGVPLKPLGYPENGWVSFNLIWYHKDIARRRDFLPSWSWSGWGGSVTFGSYALKFQALEANKSLEDLSPYEYETLSSAGGRVPQIQISLEDRTIDLYSFSRERQLNPHRAISPKELRITSFIIPLRFRKDQSVPLPKVLLAFLAKRGILLGIPVYWDREYDPESHKLGLVLKSGDQFYKGAHTYNIMVLHPVADGKYERAGVVTLQYKVNTGDIAVCGPHEGTWIPLDENDDPIAEHSRRYMRLRNEETNKYLFLRGAEWKTICLV